MAVPITNLYIDDITDQVAARVPTVGPKDGFLLVWNRTRRAWSLVVGPFFKTVDQLRDDEEAVQLNFRPGMSRSDLRNEVEAAMQKIEGLVATHP